LPNCGFRVALGWLGGPGTCLWSCKGPDLWEIPGKIAIVRIAGI
jgi:hypothetical protein